MKKAEDLQQRSRIIRNAVNLRIKDNLTFDCVEERGIGTPRYCVQLREHLRKGAARIFDSWRMSTEDKTWKMSKGRKWGMTSPPQPIRRLRSIVSFARKV